MIPNSGSLVLQRRLKIAEWIRQNGTTRVEVLGRALGVSVVTIRGDLAYLEEQGLVVRSAGRARPIQAPSADFGHPSALSRGEARPMLRLAAQLAAQETTVLLGAGGLARQLIPHLPTEPGFNLVLTELNAVAIARASLDGSLHLLGGQLDRDGNVLDGLQTVHALGLHSIGLFILQARAVLEGGLSPSFGVSETLLRAAAKRARRTLALVDDTGTIAMQGQEGLDFDYFDHVIMPKSAHHEARGRLLAAGFQQARPNDPAALLFNKTNSPGAST